MKIEEVTSMDKFAALKDQWNDLLVESGGDSVFLTYEWLFTWWEVFGAEYELFLLLCRDKAKGELLGILPCYLKTGGAPVKTRSLRLLGSEHVTSDFLECIARKGVEQDVYAAFFAHLAQKRDLWDVIEMTDVPRSSAFAGFLREQQILGPFKEEDTEKICPYIPLPGEWDEFLASLSPKTRRNVRYYRNNLGRQGSVEIEEVNTPEQLREVMQDMIRLHQQRKQQVGYAGRFSSQAYTMFHDEICNRFLEAGRLLLVFLKVDGKRIAFFYNFTFQGRVNVYQSGFDIDWSKYSIGALLMGHLIEMAISRGNRFIDFLRGHEEYKYHWTDQQRRLGDFVAYNDSLRGSFTRLWGQGLSGAKTGLKKVLPERILNDLRRFT